ncbi:MAG: hypothetical protein K9N06_00520 [Candidatus Cloacimonetes bacterium]|nr:hypothetical protein [Candidatus Cloacimonadota bacterium]
MNSSQNRLLEKAIELVRAYAGNDVEIVMDKTDTQNQSSKDYSLVIVNKDTKYTFPIEVKSYLTGNATLALLQKKLPQLSNKLIISKNISPAIAEFLKNNSISYIDARGSIFLVKDQLYLLVKANRNAIEETSYGYAFEKAGLKLLLYILQKPDLLTLNYRQISDIVNISTGSISKILKDLKHSGFYYERNGKRIIRKHQELLAQWITAFGRKLRPDYYIGKYRSQIDQSSMILPPNTFWSGEYAAELLNLNLISQNKTIYTSRSPLEFIKEQRLIPDINGNIELLQTFWNTGELPAESADTAPLIIIYADLMLSESSRNHEIAGDIYERFLHNRN